MNVAVVAKAALPRLLAHAESRGWRRLRLLSCAGNAYNRDYLGETADGSQQLPMLNVFRRDGDAIRHFWGSELLYEPPDPGQDPRHAETIDPLWNLFDFTPEGRGTDWYPALSYSSLRQRGAMRSAPSRRMTSPLSIRFSTMCAASAAYSDGRPRRGGNGIDLPSDSRASGGSTASSGVSKRPGAMVHHADARRREVARRGQRHADHAALRGAVGDLADLAVVGGDRRGVDAHAALAVLERLVGQHRRSRRSAGR